jgi:hypothetical protein
MDRHTVTDGYEPDEKDAAIARLAEDLYLSLSLYDPADYPLWHELSDDQKENYFLSVKRLLAKRQLVAAAQ